MTTQKSEDELSNLMFKLDITTKNQEINSIIKNKKDTSKKKEVIKIEEKEDISKKKEDIKIEEKEVISKKKEDVKIEEKEVINEKKEVINEEKEDVKIKITSDLRKKLSSSFVKCVLGYHLINDDPIKETPWEDINAIILNAAGCAVESQSNGSHKPGADLSCSLGQFSNKSTQYDNNNKSFKISSYRLTTVCSNKVNGKMEDIINEIKKRNIFNFYSIIIRDDSEKEILYDWYLIPNDFPALNPASYKWTPMIGKKGKNKGETTGWETNTINGSSMSITFSMSSQLWIDVNITDELKKFIIGTCKVNKGRKYTYIDLYEKEISAKEKIDININ